MGNFGHAPVAGFTYRAEDHDSGAVFMSRGAGGLRSAAGHCGGLELARKARVSEFNTDCFAELQVSATRGRSLLKR
jgi:hypothetical protein